MILYWSMTGNSEAVAERLGECLGDEIYSCADLAEKKSGGEFKSEKPWVFVCPTHAWRIPRVFESVIRLSSLQGCRDAYFVMTCGGDIGNAERYLKALCRDKMLNYRGVYSIRIEGTCEAAPPETEEAANVMRRSGSFPKTKVTPGGWLKSGIINEGFGLVANRMYAGMAKQKEEQHV